MAHEYYAIDLPGKILYKKQFNVKVRRITPLEQRYIISLHQKEQVTSKEYIDFVKKLIEFDNPEMTFEELFWNDVRYILYRIRFTTYSKHPIKLVFPCQTTNEETKEVCDEKIYETLDLSGLEIHTPDDVKDYAYTITLENLGETPIRPKTIADDVEIEKLCAKKDLDKNDPSIVGLLAELCLISGDRTLEEMYDLTEDGTVTVQDLLEVENWFEKHDWGVHEEIRVRCPKCGKEEVRRFTIDLMDFFSYI